MCYSFHSSLIGWLVGTGASIYMLSQPDIYNNWISLFILTYSQIQIFEAILWSSLEKKDINSYTTSIIPYLLLVQPLINSYMGYQITNEKILYYMSLFYIFLILYYAFITRNSTYETIISKNGTLDWNRYEGEQKVQFLGNAFVGVVYLLGLFIPLFFIPNVTMRYIAITYAFVTFFYMLYIYRSELSSRWCYAVIWLSILALIFNKK